MHPQNQSKKFHIAIIGNVGAGKSTLARLIHSQLGCELLLEEPDDYPFVTQAFDDPYRWSFTNQMQFVVTKFTQQSTLCKQNKIVVQEMDAHATHFLWTPSLHRMSYMSQAEMNIIEQVFALMASVPISLPDLYVVLSASPDALKSRISKRGRDFEELTPDFVRLIETLHEHLEQLIPTLHGKVVMIDTEKIDFTKTSEVRTNMLHALLAQIPHHEATTP